MSSSYTVSAWLNHTDSFFTSSILALLPHPTPLFGWLIFSLLTRTASQPDISPSTFTLAFTWYENWKSVFCGCRWSCRCLHGGRKILGLGHASFSLGSQILCLALPLQIPPGPLSRAGGAPVNASGSSSPGCKLPTAHVRALLYGAACMEFQSQSSFQFRPVFLFNLPFNWSMISLQCCVDFCCTTVSISHNYIYMRISPLAPETPSPLSSHPSRKSQNLPAPGWAQTSVLD